MRKLLGPSRYNRVMANSKLPTDGLLTRLTAARLGALATTLALAIGALTANASPAEAANSKGGLAVCIGLHKGKVTKLDCKTGKPITAKQWRQEAIRQNGGWVFYEAVKSDNGIFEVRLPKRLHGQTVTVTAKYSSLDATMWQFALSNYDADTSNETTRTAQVKPTGGAITVAMPTSDYAGCFSIYVTVQGETGKVYKYMIRGWGKSFSDKDNGYADITVLP